MLSLRSVSIWCVLSLAISALLITGCGFQPVYKQGGTNTVVAQVPAQLKHVAIAPLDYGRPGQELTTQLQDLLNPKGEALPKTHRLAISLERFKDAQTIEQDREITRYNLRVRADVKLIDNQTGAVVMEDNIELVASFEAVDSDFATFTAEENTLIRIMRELARDIQTRLIRHFATTED